MKFRACFSSLFLILALLVSFLRSEEAAASIILEISPAGDVQFGVRIPGDPFGQYYSVQSFLALDTSLVSISEPLRSLDSYAGTDVFWSYSIWDDNAGIPGNIIATFGSFNPGTVGELIWVDSRFHGSGYEVFTGSPASPLPLTLGERYYAGLNTPWLGIEDNLLRVSECFGAYSYCVGSDNYPDGEAWWIPFDGSPAFINDHLHDFRMTLEFAPIPEPSTALLLGLGLVGLGVRRRLH